MTDYTADNLITHLDNRGCNPKWPPLIAVDTETTEYKSCFKADYSLLAANGHLFIMGIELDQISFVHQILHVESHEGEPWVDG